MEKAAKGEPSPFAAPDKPAALVYADGRGVRLGALNQAGAEKGLVAGMSLADARAAVPELVIGPCEKEADDAALARMAHWVTRWSPHTAVRRETVGDWGIGLDITGCAHLFGGEEALLADLLARVAQAGVGGARAAVAPSFGAAWALARFHPKGGEGVRVDGAEDVEAMLAVLPIAALRVEADCVQALASSGFKTIGDVIKQKRAGLARRFGSGLLVRLDQALGRVGESLNPLSPPVPRFVTKRVLEPLMLREQLITATAELAEELASLLEARSEGVRALILRLYRADGRVFSLQAGTGAASRDGAHIARLLKERLERQEIDVDEGIDALQLAAERVERLGESQACLTARTQAQTTREMAGLTDRLAARLGASAVKRAAPAARWLPEEAWTWKPIGEALAHVMPAHKPANEANSEKPQPEGPKVGARPITRLARPEAVEAFAFAPDGPPVWFRWRRQAHHIARADGPERLAPPWWEEARAGEEARDYFHVETREGRRYWLFRRGGYGEGVPVQWFVHGAGG